MGWAGLGWNRMEWNEPECSGIVCDTQQNPVAARHTTGVVHRLFSTRFRGLLRRRNRSVPAREPDAKQARATKNKKHQNHTISKSDTENDSKNSCAFSLYSTKCNVNILCIVVVAAMSFVETVPGFDGSATQKRATCFSLCLLRVSGGFMEEAGIDPTRDVSHARRPLYTEPKLCANQKSCGIQQSWEAFR